MLPQQLMGKGKRSVASTAIDISRLNDFKYYASNLLKIKTERRQIIPFIFNKEQERLHKVWEWQLKSTGMVRLIILKDRRIGISTYVEGRLFHQTVTVPNTGGYIVTHDKPSLSKIFNMSKLFLEELPKQFRPMKRYSNKTELVFENPNEKERFTNPGLRSSIEVFSANTVTASRSGGYSVGHFSEVAFYESPEELMTSTVPSIQDLPDTIKVYESTGNGRSGFFYEQWKKAKKNLTSTRKLSNFYPIFFSWLTFPEYSRPFITEIEKKNFLDTMDEEEVFLQKKYSASFEQLNWRRSRILDFDDDIDKFHQEYPADDEEAFISKGTPYFSKKRLLQLKNKCIPPWKVGDVGEGGFAENEEGPLKLWEPPEAGREYVLAADVGEGVSGGDPSTIQVLKVPVGAPQIAQVAEWKGWIDPVMFAGKLATMAKWYNEGLVVPETKHPGFTTLNELKQVYWNIYRWQYFDKFRKHESEKLGWDTNISTKPLLCNYTASCLTADILVIRSEELIDEMFSFVRNTTNSAEADYNCHDDLVMAYMIGVFCLAHSFQNQSLLQQLGVFQEPGAPPEESSQESIDRVIERMKKNDPTKRDMELARGLLFTDDQMVDAGDSSWLNY